MRRYFSNQQKWYEVTFSNGNIVFPDELHPSRSFEDRLTEYDLKFLAKMGISL